MRKNILTCILIVASLIVSCSHVRNTRTYQRGKEVGMCALDASMRIGAPLELTTETCECILEAESRKDKIGAGLCQEIFMSKMTELMRSLAPIMEE